jgi:hypothetical protein
MHKVDHTRTEIGTLAGQTVPYWASPASLYLVPHES